MNGHTDNWMNKFTDERMNRHREKLRLTKNEWTDRGMNKQTDLW